MSSKVFYRTATIAVTALAMSGLQSPLRAEFFKSFNRDKTATSGVPMTTMPRRWRFFAALARPVSFSAEGTGLEPATPCGAPHFQCGR
jgi:hypothetical protein